MDVEKDAVSNRDHTTNLKNQELRHIGPTNVLFNEIPCMNFFQGTFLNFFAIGSLLLKWLDWLILVLEGDKLSSDELQFGFQAGYSTTFVCTFII